MRAQSADSLARIVEDLADQHGGIIPSGITQRLQAALGHPDRDVRLGAVRALGAEGCEGAADMVAGLCAHDDSFTRAEAVRTLGRLKYTGPEIAALLDDPDRNVRSQAAEALAQSRPPRELDHLIEFAFSFGGIHRREAGRLLRGIDAPAASRRFLEVLDDPERIKQWQIAIEALIELNQPQQTTGTGGRIS